MTLLLLLVQAGQKATTGGRTVGAGGYPKQELVVFKTANDVKHTFSFYIFCISHLFSPNSFTLNVTCSLERLLCFAQGYVSKTLYTAAIVLSTKRGFRKTRL